jgi:hypothetical protein
MSRIAAPGAATCFSWPTDPATPGAVIIMQAPNRRNLVVAPVPTSPISGVGLEHTSSPDAGRSWAGAIDWAPRHRNETGA